METQQVEQKENAVTTASNSKVVPGIPFVPGDPRINRKGRPVKDAAQKKFEELLFRAIKKEAKPLVKALIDKGKGGDIPALKEILERVSGAVSRDLKVEHTIPQNLIDLIKYAQSQSARSIDTSADNQK